jgi:hypothetical protein
VSVDREALQRKARYGHRCYLYWYARDGSFQWAPYGKQHLKAAILAVGTKGRFYWYDATGCSNIARSFSYMLHLWKCAPSAA